MKNYLDSIILAAIKLNRLVEEGKNLDEYTPDLKSLDYDMHLILDEVENEQA